MADAALALLNDIPYKCPPANLGKRPIIAMMSDFERFNYMCDALGIDDDSRFSFPDVEQRKSAIRISLCLWDIADALRNQGFVAVPEFAPPEDYAQLYKRSMPRDFNRIKVEKYENGASAAPTRRPLIPKLPLDSPAMQKQRAKAAAPSKPKEKKSRPKSAGGDSTTPKEKKTPKPEKPAGPSTPPDKKVPKVDPPSLKTWLTGESKATGSPTVLPLTRESSPMIPVGTEMPPVPPKPALSSLRSVTAAAYAQDSTAAAVKPKPAPISSSSSIDAPEPSAEHVSVTAPAAESSPALEPVTEPAELRVEPREHEIEAHPVSLSGLSVESSMETSLESNTAESLSTGESVLAAVPAPTIDSTAITAVLLASNEPAVVVAAAVPAALASLAAQHEARTRTTATAAVAAAAEQSVMVSAFKNAPLAAASQPAPEETSATPDAPDAPSSTSPGGGIASNDLLSSILSPDKLKPAHTQMLNAIMRSEPAQPPELDEIQSVTSSPEQVPSRSRRSLYTQQQQAVEVARSETSGTSSISRQGSLYSHLARPDSARYVRVVSKNKHGHGRATTRQAVWKTVAMFAAGAALAGFVGATGGWNKSNGSKRGGGRRGEREDMHSYPPNIRRSRVITHMGRW